MSGMEVNLIVTDFGTYVCPKEVFILKNDKRTREGKVKQRYINAVTELDEIAWELGLDGIHEILPSKGN